MDLVFDGEKPVIVCRTVFDAWLYTTTSKDRREPVRVVVSTVIALGNWSTSELTTDNDQRVFEHSSGFEVFQESRDWLVDFHCVAGVVAAKVAVLIPLIGVSDLNKSNAFF